MRAIVLENDAVLSSRFVRGLRSLPLPADLDLVKLEGCMSEAYQNPDVAPDHVKLTEREGGWCSAAYLVTFAGAALLRASQA